VTEFSPLQSEIKKLIKSSGPMPVWRYMELCLTHPQHGYYVSRDPLGREGDFTTAPEVSQMFGELLGLWAASVWNAIGSPSVLRLIELGPGRGTMMADALRALRVLPPLYQALSIHLVEINPVLREKQKAALSGVRKPLKATDRLWYRRSFTAPDLSDGKRLLLHFDERADASFVADFASIEVDEGRQPDVLAELYVIGHAHIRRKF